MSSASRTCPLAQVSNHLNSQRATWARHLKEHGTALGSASLPQAASTARTRTPTMPKASVRRRVFMGAAEDLRLHIIRPLAGVARGCARGGGAPGRVWWLRKDEKFC